MRVLVATALLLCAIVAHAATPPTFSDDFTTYEEDLLLQYQGNYAVNGNNICCPLDSPACQVEVQSQSGINSYDYTHNRTRWDDDSGQIIVNLFDVQKECLIVAQAGGGYVCQEYCPLEGETLDPFGLGDNSTYMGTKIVGNITADDWQWKEYILGKIVMQISDMYVNDNVNPPVPLQEVDQLTPFGQPIGSMTSTWSKWTPGTPDASLFNITGVDNCPMSSSCNDDARQLRRLAMKHFATWGRYMTEKYV